MRVLPSNAKHGLRRTPTQGLGARAYRLARGLESRAFALTPEQIGLAEGLRAATAVAVMVALAYALHLPWLAWGAFGAFWCCLADPGGPTRERLRAIGGFALAGMVVLPCVSLAGAQGRLVGGAVMLACVFLTNLPRAWGASAALPGVLVSVVAVVGVDYPRDLPGALHLTGAFAFGCAWALLLCVGLWRTHPHAPVRRAAASLYARLAVMTADLLALARTPTAASADWAAANAAHRRAVRLAIERARAAVARLESGQTRYGRVVDGADDVFAALIAAGHCLGHEPPPPGLKLALWHLHEALREAEHQVGHADFDGVRLAEHAGRLRGEASQLGGSLGPALALCARALAALAVGDETDAGNRRVAVARPAWGMVLRHAARVTVAVAVAYGLVAALGLSFSYWATMATVMVMQPLTEATWTRSLERIVGSVGGGVVAAVVLALAPGQPELLLLVFPLAAATIALKSVNYTLFVLFLTPLFVVVIDMLQPGEGIPAARALNNVLGTLVGLGGTLLLWPERGPGGLGVLVRAAVAANFRFAEEARAGAVTRSRQEAGLASSQAETALARRHLHGKRGAQGAAVLLEALRDVAGAATVRLIGGGTDDLDAALAVATARLKDAVL